jgi:hypothetical protein
MSSAPVNSEETSAFEPLDALEEATLGLEPERFELELAQGQFEFAKTRYIRSMTVDAVARMVASTAAPRAKLNDDIAKLREVTRTRHETAAERARDYAALLPHRVGKNWIQAPAPLERVGEYHGSERLYNLARKAAHEYAESRELLVRRRAELANLERVLREALEDNEALLMEELSSGRGLKLALRRDPLLNMSYEKLRRLEGEAREGRI